MNVFVWGTGKGSVLAQKVCREYGWEISGYIDNDTEKQGKQKDNVDILSPADFLERFGRKECILIGTAVKEVCAQAQAYGSHIIPWESVIKLFHNIPIPKPYPFETRPLQEENLCNCVLLPDRTKLLSEIAAKEHKPVMAEIGVAFGDFSHQILSICKPRKLYLIDAWEGERYAEGLKAVNSKFEKQITDGQVTVLQGYSTVQLKGLPDDELDWAYIDTVHDYDTTFQELMLCDRKVRTGGYICGHDYTKYNVYSRLDYGVYDAVNRFAVEYKYEFLYLTMEPDGLHSFCLRKMI